MKMQKYEQSGFIFELDNGFKLAVDIGSMTPLNKLEGVKVDAVIVSHIHPDHFSLEHLKKLSPTNVYLTQECIETIKTNVNFKINKIKADEKVRMNSITINCFKVDHGPNVQNVPKENLGFLFEIDGQKIYFAGDMFNPSGIDVSELEVDTALIPIGTFYTFGPKEAFEFIKKFKKVGKIIPMHYEKTPQTLEQFVDVVGTSFLIKRT